MGLDPALNDYQADEFRQPLGATYIPTLQHYILFTALSDRAKHSGRRRTPKVRTSRIRSNYRLFQGFTAPGDLAKSGTIRFPDLGYGGPSNPPMHSRIGCPPSTRRTSSRWEDATPEPLSEEQASRFPVVNQGGHRGKFAGRTGTTISGSRRTIEEPGFIIKTTIPWRVHPSGVSTTPRRPT
jgi:hypothetical protein